MQNYLQFLETKKKRIAESGFAVNDAGLNPFLFDFQRHIVKTALRMGRYAIFADCGLGKTLMQLEWAKQVSAHTNAPVLILTPLAVAGQTIKEGAKFGIPVIRYCGQSGSGVYVVNYEQLDNIDCEIFGGVVLDESSILKNFEGKTRSAIIDGFKKTPYKLACTATPSPNDPMELGNHSEFLNVMSRNEMLAMYFVHDGGDTSKWRIKGHAQQTFYEWVSEWAVMLSKPSDIGFSANGYDLPALNLIEQQIKTAKRNNGMLFNDVNISATDFNAELRLTKVERLDQVASIVNNSDENFIIWIKQNEEGDLVRKLIPEAVEVRGDDSPEYKEQKLLGFANGDFRVLVTKTKIAQFGLNYQNCRNQVFASLDFSFEGLYQAIRRSYRFGQKNSVNIYMITTDTMQNVINSVKEKEQKFAEMQAAMTAAVNKNIHSNKKEKMQRDQETFKTESAELRLGDCVQLIQEVQDQSIGFSIFSPPFAELYTYSDELEDMGNSKDYNEFLYAFSFLTKELFRVIQNGRNVAVHCMDLPIQKGKEGYIGLRDFSGMILKAFDDAGFIYHSRVTIWKDPVTEMQRTKALGLLHKQIKKDAVMSRVGIPDYLMIFRKPGENNNPVTHQDDCSTMPNYLPVDLWQKYASPVWMDIDYGDTLNYRAGRDEKDEKHICPLQLPTIQRAIHLWTNEGDTVLSPFAGIGSELYQAVKMNRKAIGFELKQSYFELACQNLKACEVSKSQISLF
ncbi:MAG: DNA methyltransferase [Saprospiraceae bacterium]